jgi:exodeoxyribonuclease-1
MVLLVSDSAARPTFLFHDYETFGTHPALDRPAQFAAIRTDDEFNIIGEPEVFYCKPADDYLPQPGAVMVTGITPQEAREKGVNEAEFARRIHDLFTVPNTCVVGYNNIRFDDEVTRNFLSQLLRSVCLELAEPQLALGSAGYHARLLCPAS